MNPHRCLIIALSLCAIFTAYSLYYMLCPVLPTAHGPLVVTVKPGWSLPQISAELHRQGLNSHPWLYRSLVRVTGASRHLQAGEYAITADASLWSLTRDMREGKVVLYSFTIVEGWDARALLGALDQAEFLIVDTDRDLLLSLVQPDGQSAEGWFFPSTYYAKRGEPASALVAEAHALMSKTVTDLWPSCDSYCGLRSPRELLIVASLIEKETRYPEEMPRVAGVICRRLQKHMPLQIDASVRYGLHWPSRLLSRKDLKIDTPYNTYLHRGLPPTAIAMPSLPALQAACHPSHDEALYYVVSPGGKHHFSATYAEHRRAIQRYKAYRRQQNTSTDVQSQVTN